jgi:hypothetical protein
MVTARGHKESGPEIKVSACHMGLVARGSKEEITTIGCKEDLTIDLISDFADSGIEKSRDK